VSQSSFDHNSMAQAALISTIVCVYMIDASDVSSFNYASFAYLYPTACVYAMCLLDVRLLQRTRSLSLYLLTHLALMACARLYLSSDERIGFSISAPFMFALVIGLYDRFDFFTDKKEEEEDSKFIDLEKEEKTKYAILEGDVCFCFSFCFISSCAIAAYVLRSRVEILFILSIACLCFFVAFSFTLYSRDEVEFTFRKTSSIEVNPYVELAFRHCCIHLLVCARVLSIVCDSNALFDDMTLMLMYLAFAYELVFV
jgi:hypothetical protein